MDRHLPSWRHTATRAAVQAFLDAADEVPVEARVAVFDNDGTLWCEKPQYTQMSFFMRELAEAVRRDPALGEREEYAALLSGDLDRIAAFDLPRLAQALVELFVGMSPEQFSRRVRSFVFGSLQPLVGATYASARYQPMLELIDELRRRQFDVFLVTGGGAEFVRAVSQELYGVPPEGVVGTLVAYDYNRRSDGAPELLRTARVLGRMSEGPTKVTMIQAMLGRRPILAAGNSAGDRDMMEWATSGEHPSLALLVNHNDAEREAAYASVSGTLEETEPIVDIGQRLGWTIVSMKDDWSTIFQDGPRRE